MTVTNIVADTATVFDTDTATGIVTNIITARTSTTIADTDTTADFSSITATAH